MTTAKAELPYWRLSSFYFFYFAFLGAWVPFWNLYLEQSLKFSAEQIGVLSALVMGTKIVGPSLWGWLADHYGHRMAIIRWGSLAAALAFVAVFVWQGYLALALIILLYSFFWNAVLAQFEVITLCHLRDQSAQYTRIRLWGSIGFIVAVFGLGWLFDWVSIDYLPHFLLFILVGIWLCSLVVQEPPTHKDEVIESVELNSFQQFLQQLKQPVVIVFFIACFLIQFSHGPYYTFFSIYLEQLGYQRVAIGALWSLGVAAEVVLFIFMPSILARYSLLTLMLVTLLLTAIRWFMIAFLAENLLLLIVAQCLHAASFGSFHAVSIELVRRYFGAGSRGQGQAFYSAVSFGAGGALGALMSGWFWYLGATWAFSLAGVSVVFGLVIMLLAAWRWPQQMQGHGSGR